MKPVKKNTKLDTEDIVAITTIGTGILFLIAALTFAIMYSP